MINYDDNENDPIETAVDKIVDKYIKESYSEIKYLKEANCCDDNEINLPF